MLNAGFQKYIWIAISLLLLVGCASQPVSLKHGVKPDLLEVCIDFSFDMNSDEKLLHLDAVNSFIESYNAQALYYKLLPCTKAENRSVTLTVQGTRYIAPSEQVLYVLVSSFGISSILNGGLGFAWAGFSATQLGVKLSDDIADNSKAVYRQFYSSPYFRDLASVKIHHMEKFQMFMFELFDELKQSEQLMGKPQVAD